MKRLLSALLIFLLTGPLQARSTADYLPSDAAPDPNVPTPESFLGWDVGERHVGHDALVSYMYALAESSPRVSIREIGRTHEKRPLLQLVITSPQNQARLEELRQAHLGGDGPLVAWLGYSVHGDEPSGSNASMLVAYHLASSGSGFVEELLEGTVVLLDPSINPDGLDRFASWANQNAARNPVANPVTRQHMQPWPGARTNHYWFDLNRDWLPLVHPESRVRINEFHRWLPHVLTDHHEQGGRNPGFFFQPGVPSRQNPLTPDENLELTRALATHHAEALDRVGQPFFTEDAYDDFYFGKGSTYPDINGSVGILFEQRAIRGQRLDTVNGVETFEQAIRNQFEVSLSTLHGAWAMRDRLKNYQSGFHNAMLERAKSRKFDAWLVGDDGDPARAAEFLHVMEMHRIEYRPLGETVRVDGQTFEPGSAWVLPVRQRQFGLLEAIMEQRTHFADNTFYDVSAWTLPLAFNLPFATVSRTPKTTESPASSQGLAPKKSARAWLVPWSQLGAPALLQDLLEAGARVRTARKPFSAETPAGIRAFERGTLVVHAGIQDEGRLESIYERLVRAAMAGIAIESTHSSLTPSGPDIGASHFAHVEPVSPLILGGEGASSYDTGATWHLLDARLGIRVPVVEQKHFDRVDLSSHTHLLLADGRFGGLSEKDRREVTRWIRSGGILIASGRAAAWAETLCFERECDENGNDSPAPDEAPRPYSDFGDDHARLVIGGAIVQGVADLSHPLCYGIRRPMLPLFRQGTVLLEPGTNAYATPVRYTNDPLLAGFVGEERLDEMRGQAAVVADRRGKGLVVRFANSPLFRGFWRGTERLYVNALYFGQTVRDTTLPSVTAPARSEPERH